MKLSEEIKKTNKKNFNRFFQRVKKDLKLEDYQISKIFNLSIPTIKNLQNKPLTDTTYRLLYEHTYSLLLKHNR
jgi:hypothetical protein